MAGESEAVSQGEVVAGLPSGQRVTLQDVIWGDDGPQGRTVRFRFVAPQIAPGEGAVGFDAAAADMKVICETFAMSRIVAEEQAPAQVIISLSDRAVPFGEADPEATQFFEAYRLEDGACIWEMF